MKKTYKSPVLCLLEMNIVDIITTSKTDGKGVDTEIWWKSGTQGGLE